MSFEFVIPITRDDLLRRNGNQYYVRERTGLNRVVTAIKDFEVALRRNPYAVLDHFDTIFSVLCHKDATQRIREEAWDVICRGAVLLTKNLADDIDDIQLRPTQLNAVKMTCYLLCQLLEMFEAQETALIISTAQGRKKASTSEFNAAKEKKEGIQILLGLVKVNLNKLWDPPIAEEEFVSLITNCGYKLLENSTINQHKDTRETIFQLIAVMVKNYNHYLGASLKIIQLIQHFEHLVAPLASAVAMFVKDYGVKYVACEITREIGRMDPKDLERDASGCRSYATFLVDLTEKIPSVMLQNISTLLGYLDEEAYPMRNCVLGMMGEILIKVLSQDELEKNLKTTRDEFIETMQEHVHDVNAFVRSKVLQIWMNIVNQKCLPVQEYVNLAKLVIGRIEDMSSIVRCHGIQLLTALLKNNPFISKLQPEPLKEKLQEEQEKLAKLMAENEEVLQAEMSQNKDADCKEAWKFIGKELKAWLKKKDRSSPSSDSDSDIIEEQDTAEIMTGKIYNYLAVKNFDNAYKFVLAAQDAWPDFELFQFDVNEGDGFDSDDDGSTEKEAIRDDEKLLNLFSDLFASHYATVIIPSRTQQEPTQANAAVLNDVAKQQVVVNYLKDCHAFSACIQTAVPIISERLESDVISEVQESIEFFVFGVNYGVSSAIFGIRKMLGLIWSKEGNIKDAVIDAYRRLYLTVPTGNQRAKSLQIVKNLSTLSVEATLGELISLEEMVIEFMNKGDIDNAVVQVLWEIFTMKIANTTTEESKSALLLISMLAGAEMSIIKSNIDVLIKEGLGPRAEEDLWLARQTCIALMKLGDKAKLKGELAEKPFRLVQEHELFIKLTTLMISQLSKEEIDNWIPFAIEAINVIYKLAEHPDVICGDMLKSVANNVLQSAEDQGAGDSDKSIPSYLLARFITLTGEMAFRQLVHVDNNIAGELKRRRAVQENSRTNKTINDGNKSKNNGDAETIEEELGLGGAVAEDAEAEYIRAICEKEIVTGQTLLASIAPLLTTICHNQSKYTDPKVQTAATLALSKYMIVSSEYCDSNLQLLFTILEKSKHPEIRANTIIALGDLTIRFPNLIEPWTPNLYARLRDHSPVVRKTTLQVLTHLILNDRVKVKGQISEMACCITDDNEKISDMAMLFFDELSHKGNAVYNIMPDIISRLSDTDTGVSDESFRTIMDYLFSFITKDKQCEGLVEKLCLRYKATNVENRWKHLSYCLSLLPYNEKSVKKLLEHIGCYADKLGDKDIYGCFTTILSNAKTFAKITTKSVIDELEEKVKECHNKGAEEIEVAMKASFAKKYGKSPKSPRKSLGKKSPIKSPKTATAKKKKKPKIVFDEEDSDLELFDVDKTKNSAVDSDNEALNSDSESAGEVLSPVKSHPSRKTPGRKIPLRNRRILEDSD